MTITDSDTADISGTLGQPVIGVAKAAGEAVSNGDGTFTLSISIVLENLGPLDLSAVQVVDDLATTFPPPSSVISVTQPIAMITAGNGLLTHNPAFDGTGDIDLLVASTSTLDIDARGEIFQDALVGTK